MLPTLRFRKGRDEKALDSRHCGKNGMLPCFSYSDAPAATDPNVVLLSKAGPAAFYQFACGCYLLTLTGQVMRQ